MGYLIDGNDGELTIDYAGAGLPHGANTVIGIHKTTAAALNQSDCDYLALRWSLRITELLSSSVSQVSATLKCGPNETGPSFLSTTVQAGLATAMGASAPSVLVRKNTALGGRRGRGRIYLPGISESNIDPGGYLNGTYLASVQSNFVSLMTDWLTINCVPTVTHSANLIDNPSPPPFQIPDPTWVPIGPTVVTSFSVQAQVATQRRRQRR
jgi:hypothetical protein